MASKEASIDTYFNGCFFIASVSISGRQKLWTSTW